MGFFGKVFAGTVAVILITALVMYASSVRALEDQVQLETGARVEHESRLVAQFVQQSWIPSAGSCDEDILREAADALGESRVTLIARDGRVLFDSHEDEQSMENHLDREELASPSGLVTRFSRTLQKEMIYFAQPIEVGGEQVAWSRIAVSIQDRDARLRDLNTAVRDAVLLAGLIALVLAAVVARQITRPLRTLGEYVAEVGRGAAPAPIRATRGSEIGRLTGAVNTMAAELNQRIGRIQRDKAEREAILSGIADGLIAVDTEHKMLFINGPAREILRAPEGSVKGRPIGELSDSEQLSELLDASASTSEAVQAEGQFPGPDGERFVELSAVPLPGEDGQRRGSVLVLRDVTELRHLEAVRRDFVSNVSHELKTPLTAMRGYVDAVLEDGDMPAMQRATFLEKAQQNTERLTSIVTDLLSLSRLESQERELSFEEIEVREVLEEVLDDSRDLAESRQVSLELEDPGERELAWADAQALHMAFSNLVSNAIHYSPQDSGKVRVRLGSTGEHVFVDVIDNGPGIPASEHERIFERFYRVDKARSRRLGGTGLGLSIVRHVVAAHNGQVALESAPGEGSRFRVTLPAVG